MLALAIVILTVAAGWFGWSYWWAILLGYCMFAATFSGRREAALEHKNSAWLVAPLIALLLMWIGHIVHQAIG